MSKDTELMWYQGLSYSDADTILGENITNIKRSFIAAGYYLKYIRDNEMYKEDGYGSIWEYAQERYGISVSTASRWMKMNDRFSVDGNSPIIEDKYKGFGKCQLQEMLYLEDGQIEAVTPGMTVKEIREARKPEPEPEEEPVSVLGYPLRVYPEDSLLKTPGCGKQDCYSCHRDGCNIRQEDCYCVEAPMGNPFTCTTLNAVDNLRREVGSKCQFVNEDLAYHRAGDGQPVPCCKKCNNPCGYECNRSVRNRYQAEKAQQEEMLDVTQDESIEEKRGTSIDNLDLNVRTYNLLKRAGIETIEEVQRMSDADLAKIRNFSRKCMDEVYSKLEEYERNNSEKSVATSQINEEGKDDTESDIDINNNINNVVEEQPKSATDLIENATDEPAIDAEYREIASEDAAMRCQKAAELDELNFSQIAVRDYLEDEERTLAEYIQCDQQEKGFPQRLLQRQQILVKALRLLMESETTKDDQDGTEEPEEIKQAQPELPILRNDKQRKEWLKNYKDWPVWFEVPEADEIYYRYDLPDGSSIVICEYRMWIEWKEKYTDENPDSIGTREYLLMPGYRYLHDCHSNTSALVGYLKNLLKG